MSGGLRLLVFDRTQRRAPWPGLSRVWWAGRALYRALGRLDGGLGAASWAEALDWLAAVGPGRPLAEVQFWGHGHCGGARIDGDVLDERMLSPGHPDAARLRAVRARLLPGADGLWWFRTCETFGAPTGRRFAAAFARFLGCRVAGHTHRIGFLQSGLHALLPGEEPGWPEDEGRAVGPDEEPARGGGPSWRAAGSSWRAPHTITCLDGSVPRGARGRP